VGDNVQIFDMAEFLVQRREFMEMSGEQAKSVDLGGDLSVHTQYEQRHLA
jgi:hypothetical protein